MDSHWYSSVQWTASAWLPSGLISDLSDAIRYILLCRFVKLYSCAANARVIFIHHGGRKMVNVALYWSLYKVWDQSPFDYLLLNACE